jgi:KEOPS complex subunit Pcc1
MAIRAKANIRIGFQSEKQLSSLLDGLMREANAPLTRRANVKLKKDGLFLDLSVDAIDTVALRSTLNTYLRWINSMMSVLELLEHQ